VSVVPPVGLLGNHTVPLHAPPSISKPPFRQNAARESGCSKETIVGSRISIITDCLTQPL